MGAVGKTMWNSDAEDILIETGLCKQGTANKRFALAWDYYQSMRGHKILREAMANLHTDAFEQWATYCAYCKMMDQTLMKLASF